MSSMGIFLSNLPSQTCTKNNQDSNPAIFFKLLLYIQLTEEIILRAAKNSPNDAKTLILRRFGLGKCGEKVVTSVELIDLSENDLQTVTGLFSQFPSGWWFDLSENAVCFS